MGFLESSTLLPFFIIPSSHRWPPSQVLRAHSFIQIMDLTSSFFSPRDPMAFIIFLRPFPIGGFFFSISFPQ